MTNKIKVNNGIWNLSLPCPIHGFQAIGELLKLRTGSRLNGKLLSKTLSSCSSLAFRLALFDFRWDFLICSTPFQELLIEAQNMRNVREIAKYIFKWIPENLIFLSSSLLWFNNLNAQWRSQVFFLISLLFSSKHQYMKK